MTTRVFMDQPRSALKIDFPVGTEVDLSEEGRWQALCLGGFRMTTSPQSTAARCDERFRPLQSSVNPIAYHPSTPRPDDLLAEVDHAPSPSSHFHP